MSAKKSTAARTGSSGRSGRSGRPRKSDQLLTPAQKVKEIMKEPEKVGWAVGFRDLTHLHGEWISEMVIGTGDYTLQAHRGSYKSSCLAVAIALIMVLDPKKNIIFLRKTDNDVAEMLGMLNMTTRRTVRHARAGYWITGITEEAKGTFTRI